MPYFVGITGNSGCGKSTALKILREAGYRVMDFDSYSVQVIQEANNPVRKRLEEIMGDTVAEDGIIDFKKIGAYFDCHMEQEISFDSWYQEYLGKRIRCVLAQQFGEGTVFIDMPLVCQRKIAEVFNRIWLIKANLNTCHTRIRARNHYDDRKIEYLITRSIVSDEAFHQTVSIIRNDGTMEDYRSNILEAASAIEIPGNSND